MSSVGIVKPQKGLFYYKIAPFEAITYYSVMVPAYLRLKGMKVILIVEDEKSLRHAMVDILRRKGFLPMEAKNGREGVDLALAKHPDLILLDLIMPEMDGMAALKIIRADAWGTKVPIIILTNLSAINGNVAADAIAHTPTQYLIKSDWKLHDIMRKIETLLGAEITL